jgi:hypothetical protein
MASIQTYPRMVEKSPGARCNICLNVAPLTEDHVPPKSCVEDLRVELEPFEHRLYSPPPRLPLSQNGLRFKTLCGSCNSLLGVRFDPILATFVSKVRSWLRSPLILSDRWTVRTEPDLIVKSLFGHLLAASAKDPDTIQDREMRGYLLGTRTVPGPATKVLYWLHSGPAVSVLRAVAMPSVRGHFGDVGIFSIIKMPPVGFMVTTLDEYEGLPRLDSISARGGGLAEVRLSKNLIRDSDWPERVDEGNFIAGGESFRDGMTARPVGKQRHQRGHK